MVMQFKDKKIFKPDWFNAGGRQNSVREIEGFAYYLRVIIFHSPVILYAFE